MTKSNATSLPERLPLTRKFTIASIFSEKQQAHGKGSQGREERKGLNYEREFMHLEWLFRAREIFLPQGPMA